MNKSATVFVISLSLTFSLMRAQGAGFALNEHSAIGTGRAYAGMSAAADDASTVWWNPAGMALLPGTEVMAAAHAIIPDFSFDDQGSTLSPLLRGAPIAGNEGGDFGDTEFTGGVFASAPLNETLTLGLGVNVPYGLATDYDPNWVGRYHALKSEAIGVNVNPSLAVKANDALALGFGLNALYFDAELSNAIDQSALCLGLQGGVLPIGTCTTAGLTAPGNPTTDGLVKLSADDWGYGYNAGALLRLAEQAHIGLHYRSKVDLKLTGEADFSGIHRPFAAQPLALFVNTGGKADLTLPATLSLDGYVELTQRLAIMGGVTWTDWSQFETLRVRFDNPTQPDTLTTEDWQDAYRYSLSVSFKATERLTIRAGTAFDETPVPNAQRRTARIPDEDRTWVAVGLSFAPTASLSLDVGYAHLFIDDARIDNTLESSVPTANARLRGEYDISSDIVSAQVRWLL